MSLDLRHQPLVTDLPALSLGELPDALRDFCQRPAHYRQRFAQQHYGVAFDGYSYPGQDDSLNQGPEDHLHSFVFSDFYPSQRYPAELQPFIDGAWQELTCRVRELEQSVLGSLGLDSIAIQHARHFGHMMSANYYPPLEPATGSPRQPAMADPTPLRLSAHPDVSLLTVFPAGMGADFQYQDATGNWVDAPANDRVVIFAGDLLQWLSDGNIPALNHRVKQGKHPGERFSFALFSLPMPGVTLCSSSGETITTEEWYRLHLSQWDY